MLLHGSHPLPDGRRVRLRLPHAADRDGLHDLLAALGLEAEDLEVRRALSYRPGRRIAICATAWEDGRDRLVGFGALDVERGELTLLAPHWVARLLAGALREQARTSRRRVA